LGGGSTGLRGAWRPASSPKGLLYRGVFALAGESSGADAPTPGSCLRDARMARVEAVLLLAREPLSSRKLAQITSLADGTEARTLVRGLNRYYQQRGTAFRIEEVAGGFQLYARPQFGPWLRRLYQSPVQTRLSSPALETLAVVAYRQPVLRADVEAIRGVQSGEILRQLMERDLVRIVGRSPELGRPFLYGTTKRFLRIFGLRHLEDLPRVASLRPVSPTEKTPGRSGDLDTTGNCQRQEEPEVSITALLEPPTEGRHASQESWPLNKPPAVRAAKDEEGEEFEDEEDEDDDYDDEDDLEEDDLEEEEWEEVDDEDEEEEEFDDEDEDWEDEDEDDDWDDDEDEDWEDEDEE
jgi:segregation and condensation protein B